MKVIDQSAIDALHRMEQVRKAREDRMRNALEILASIALPDHASARKAAALVHRVAREGLGQETE